MDVRMRHRGVKCNDVARYKAIANRIPKGLEGLEWARQKYGRKGRRRMLYVPEWIWPCLIKEAHKKNIPLTYICEEAFVRYLSFEARLEEMQSKPKKPDKNILEDRETEPELEADPF